MKRISRLIILIAGIALLSRVSYAEQSGSSPDSGTGTSVLRTGYNWLVAKGTNYGATQPADWTNNWGIYWNRIMYSAFWEPDGDATESNVLAGKTFYSGNNNRTLKTGAALAGSPPDYSLEQYVDFDDGYASDYTGEESIWTNTNTSPATLVWKDARTGLYWARSEPTTLTNSFTTISSATCDFFTTAPRGNYGVSSTDPDCGDAINACAVLSLASTSGQSANTDWYLPSQKEFDQAYIDGIYNQAGASFTRTGFFWSSTEYSLGVTNAFTAVMYSGQTAASPKSTATYVRCVRID